MTPHAKAYKVRNEKCLLGDIQQHKFLPHFHINWPVSPCIVPQNLRAEVNSLKRSNGRTHITEKQTS